MLILNSYDFKDMKKDTHPTYGPATIVCACGSKLDTSSTQKEIRVEVCSSCHPFFTGKHKFVDTAGRVDKFKARLERTEAAKAKVKVKKITKRLATPAPARSLKSLQGITKPYTHKHEEEQ